MNLYTYFEDLLKFYCEYKNISIDILNTIKEKKNSEVKILVDKRECIIKKIDAMWDKKINKFLTGKSLNELIEKDNKLKKIVDDIKKILSKISEIDNDIKTNFNINMKKLSDNIKSVKKIKEGVKYYGNSLINSKKKFKKAHFIDKKE